jgi:multidrug efflux pump subunit AcrA (membrane-fusion protein)
MRRRFEAVAAVFVMSALVASASGCDAIRKMHGKPVVERRDTRATPGASGLADADAVVAPGIVEPWGGEVALSPLESGWIARIDVAEGESVEAGQVLALLDDAVQRAAVALARAGLAEAEATAAKTARGATVEELRQARGEAEASEVRADWARRDAERTAHLGSEAAVAPTETDRARAEADALTATARSRAARLAEIERGARSEDRAAADDRVLAARARLELAQTNLERRRVVAPAASTVLLSRFHAGEYYAVGGAPLLVVGDESRVQVRLEVDEIDALRATVGGVCLLFGDDESKIGEGRVVRVAPRMGRRVLSVESPTARADVRVCEVFVEADRDRALLPGRRVWGHLEP